MMRYLIWLQCALGAANPHAVKALSHFSSAENIYKATPKERADSKIFTRKELEKLNGASLSSALEIIADCRKNSIEIIGFGSEKYPYCLSVLDDAPIVLYVKGNLPDFDNLPSVCVVGPRKVSEFGKKAAYSLSYRLAASGFTVVSGGALGTDTYAHAGALKAAGKTVLCMGCGIMSDYLPENKKLRNAVSKSGCLLSEYPPYSEPTRYTFPVRNRIMSALTLGTVVIEAPNRSGALITARHANEQGRDVFVVPGSPNKREYEGSNALLRDGAKPLLDVSDIFSEYIIRFPDKINVEKAFEKSPIAESKSKEEKINKKIQKKFTETLSNEAKIVYNQLDKQFFFPEEISVPNLSDGQLLSALTELEMEFLIRALPGGKYEKL